MSATGAMTATSIGPPVVVVHDDRGDNNGNNGHDVEPRRKRAKTTPPSDGGGNKVLLPGSDSLLDDMLGPLSREEFMDKHFRKDAVHVQRRRSSRRGALVGRAMVADICKEHLFGLDARRMFAETSSENVFLWLRSSPSAANDASNDCSGSSNGSGGSSPPPTLNSVEISDPDTAYSLHVAGRHAAYCRAPPSLERALVGPLLRATGLGGGHYHPPHHDVETATLGGGTTLGRGEVELFIGAPSVGGGARSTSAPRERDDDGSDEDSISGINDDDDAKGEGDGGIGGGGEGGRRHTTGWHTDFQENFTIQLSGVKRWTLRRGRVRHPLRGTTPHYARDPSVVEDQLKAARLSCRPGRAGGGGGDGGAGSFDGPHGFEYGDENAYGPEQTVTLYPGDVLYFPAGMWHCVETLEAGVSANVSLMGTTYASLVSRALEHLMLGSGDEGWREVVTSRPGEDGTARLQGLLGGLSRLVDDFATKGGGAGSLLPPALCHPPMSGGDDDGDEEEEEKIDENCGSAEEEDHGSSDEGKGSSNEPIKGGGHVVEEGEEEDDDDHSLLSGIVVSVDDFEGPPGWTCKRPTPNARLIRNPLAALMAMDDTTGRRRKRRPESGVDGGKNDCSSDDDEDQITGATKRYYVLNVNYARSEMMESHVRVVFEASGAGTTEAMDRCLELEDRGQDLGCISADGWLDSGNEGDDAGIAPPLCLFYYGYLVWSNNV